MDDDNSIEELGFDVLVDSAAAAFVVVCLITTVTSAAKMSFDSVSPPAVLAFVGLVVLIFADANPDVSKL